MLQSGALTVHVIDDDNSLRRALSRLLTVHGYTVSEYDSAEAFLDAPARGGGCIVLDIGMPGLSGVQLQERLNERGHALPIIFLTGQADIATSVKTIKAGAEDFLCKPVDQVSLTGAVERALRRYAAESGDAAKHTELAERVATLTPREREVFDLVLAGLLNKQIAGRLGTVERTIKAHRASVMAKMRVRSVAELAAIASQIKLLPA